MTIESESTIVDEFNNPVETEDRLGKAIEALQTVEDEPEEGEEGKVKPPPPKVPVVTPSEEDAEKPDGKAFKALRKQKANLRAQEEYLNTRVKELEEREAKISRLEKLRADDPEAFVKEIAQDPDKFFEKWASRKINDGKITPAELLEKYNQLVERLEKKEREEELAREKAKLDAERAQAENATREVDNTYLEMVSSNKIDLSDGTSVVISDKFPDFAAVPEGTQRLWTIKALQHARQHAPQTTFLEVLAHLDKIAAEEYGSYAEKRVQVRPSGQPAKPVKRGQLTNADQAAVSGNSRDLSDSERIASAAKFIPEEIFDGFNSG